MQLKGHQSALLGATGLSIAAWFVPVLNLAFLPIQYLNTHFHELCHAIAAVATGGSPQMILVHADGSGETPVAGGLLPVVASAGYVGAIALGGLLIAFGRDEKSARKMLGGMAIVLGLSMAVWVRGDWIGLAWGAFWVLVLGGLALRAKGKAAVFAIQFLGVQQCVNALLSVSALLQISVMTERQSDAKIMESASGGVPAIVWAVLWAAVGIAAIVLALRRAWR